MEKTDFSFERFLYGRPAEDYVRFTEPYEEQLRRASSFLKEADSVLIGAGAGMSTAAGAVYGGPWFQENFREFVEKYGNGPYMQDMYGAGFYPYPSEAAYWGYWSKQCMLAGILADHTSLHKTLLGMLKDKNIFCLSTNADGQFVKAGLPDNRIFCTQGDYFHIQCKKGCHPKTYDAVEMFRQMDAHRKNCLVPEHMVPKCPVCGGPMNMNLRIDGNFVQGEEWYGAEKNFENFMCEALVPGKKLCLLEVGVGFNTPMIIRFPFEKLTNEHKNVTLIRLNLKEGFLPESIGGRAVGIEGDMKKTITDLAGGKNDDDI